MVDAIRFSIKQEKLNTKVFKKNKITERSKNKGKDIDDDMETRHQSRISQCPIKKYAN
ncbi:hypothetical protein VIN01S_30130 [Vibrio inusitatus NBRC 102082]|uniref:Uncharacterized protein n=1 Tax=Vibrio inusitatus NBRC 102082 TaxID=1219070 RepID=A0A4Y3HYF7_9VIBR|nr:hypothetical protein VIN01S_30130 [Vibrio inusitatus NBRC 102082]